MDPCFCCCFQHTYNTLDQLQSDYNQQCGNKQRRVVNNEGGDTSQNTEHVEVKEEDLGDDKSQIGPEVNESEIGTERGDSRSRKLSNILKSVQSIDLKLQNILTDNFCGKYFIF